MMKKKSLSLLLALALCLGLLPMTVSAAETDLPDWYFLFAIFKNVDADGIDADSVKQHTKYTMSQEEVDGAWGYAKEFETYLNQLGVIRAHVDVVEIDTTVTELINPNDESDESSKIGSYIGAEQAAPLLKDKVDLDKYDHVTCIVSLDINTAYGGVTGNAFENGTGQSCINFVNQEKYSSIWAVGVYPWVPGYPVHEYLHFMESMSKRWNGEFSLHDIMLNFYERVNGEYEECYTDILLNRARGTAGTGIAPIAWQYPPHVFRTMHEFTIPSSVTSIEEKFFQDWASLSKVTIHSGVRTIGVAAFERCRSLTEIVIPSSVTSIGEWAFQGCTALSQVSIPASVTSIGYAAFWEAGITDVYYSGTETQWKAIQFGEFNEALTNATIRYNSVPIVTVDSIPASGTAYASTQNITIDGKSVKFDAYALKDANGNLTHYVKLRDVTVALNGTAAQFEVGFDGAISLTTKTAYTGGSDMGTPFSGNRTYQDGTQSVKVNGQSVKMTAITLYDSNNNGYNYFKLRDLGAVLGFTVGYSNETGISINTAG